MVRIECSGRRRPRRPHDREAGRITLVFLLLVLVVLALVPAGCTAFRMMDKTAPAVNVKSDAKAIGARSARITIEADEPRYGIRSLRAVFVQGSVEVPLGELSNPGSPWWRFWRRDRKPSALLGVEVGRDRVPELKEGQAVIRAGATNGSGADVRQGRTTRQGLAGSHVPW